MKEKKLLASGSILLCAAALVSVWAMPLSAREPGSMQKRAADSMFADQDNEAKEVRKLAEKGNYVKAIKRLKENVIEPLKAEGDRIDSWKVRQRLNEFCDELREMQLTYGNMKMQQAEEAFAEHKYEDAIAIANEAKDEKITDGLFTERATQLIGVARSKINAADRRNKAAAAFSDPELEQREITIKHKLAAANSYYRKGLYDKAWQLIEEVYVLNPYNADASYLASQLYKKFYQAGYHRRKADIETQMAYEAWQWVEPVFPVRAGNDIKKGEKAIVKEGSDYAVQKKLDEIVFPMVSFNQLELEAVVQFMRNNKSMDPDKEGVMITFIQPNKAPKKIDKEAEARKQNMPQDDISDGENAEEDEEGGDDDWGVVSEAEETSKKATEEDGIFVTLELRNVTLRQLLDYVCFLTDLTYVVRDNRVFFGAQDKRMSTHNYEIFNSVKVMIAGRKGGAPAAAGGGDAMGEDMGGEDMGGDDFGGEDDFGEAMDDDMGGDAAADGGEAAAAAPPPQEVATVNDSDLTPDALKNFFSLYGIEFPEGSSISYFRNEVVMNNTEENHRKMRKLMEDLNVEAPMVEVEVKSIELAESDMEELGFHWALGTSIGNVRKGSQWQAYEGANTAEDGGGMMKLLNAALSGVDSRVISNLNIFPDLFGSFSPFGIDGTFNLTLTINALDRSDRTEQISAPRVLVANGVTARVKMTKAYFFPEDWEELEIESDEVGDSGNYSFDITYPSPEFAESETDIGTVFTVTPTILQGNKTIRLNLNPKITAYTGKDEYTVEWEVYQEGGRLDEDQSGRVTVWRPVIATRELNVQVDVNHGETLVIGGLSDSQTQKRLDKIPILADIPFIGRLFQSQSEVSTRRNMLIFVTARLISNDGSPLPMVESLGNGGLPQMMR